MVTHVTHCLSWRKVLIRLLYGGAGWFQSSGPAQGSPSQAEHLNLATGPKIESGLL